MSGREKIWYVGRVIWINIPDEKETDTEEPPDLWPDLLRALDVLTDKQRFVIELRYGLKDGMAGDFLELDEVADLLGISKQAVKRIEDRAIERMRRLTST